MKSAKELVQAIVNAQANLDAVLRTEGDSVAVGRALSSLETAYKECSTQNYIVGMQQLRQDVRVLRFERKKAAWYMDRLQGLITATGLNLTMSEFNAKYNTDFEAMDGELYLTWVMCYIFEGEEGVANATVANHPVSMLSLWG